MWETDHRLETTVAPEAIWRAWTDVARWPEWNTDIDRVELAAPFAAGGTITMSPQGQAAGAELAADEAVFCEPSSVTAFLVEEHIVIDNPA